MSATTTEYIKIYHNNGRHLQIGSGTWPKARDEAAAALKRSRQGHHGDESVELQLYMHGQRTVVKTRTWHEILVKMGDADASTHIVFVFAMVAWIAAAQLLLPMLGGI